MIWLMPTMASKLRFTAAAMAPAPKKAAPASSRTPAAMPANLAARRNLSPNSRPAKGASLPRSQFRKRSGEGSKIIAHCVAQEGHQDGNGDEARSVMSRDDRRRGCRTDIGG